MLQFEHENINGHSCVTKIFHEWETINERKVAKTEAKQVCFCNLGSQWYQMKASKLKFLERGTTWGHRLFNIPFHRPATHHSGMKDASCLINTQRDKHIRQWRSFSICVALRQRCEGPWADHQTERHHHAPKPQSNLWEDVIEVVNPSLDKKTKQQAKISEHSPKRVEHVGSNNEDMNRKCIYWHIKKRWGFISFHEADDFKWDKS